MVLGLRLSQLGCVAYPKKEKEVKAICFMAKTKNIAISSLFQNIIHTFAFAFAPVAKLVDAPDLGSGVSRRVGSSPIRRTE